MHGAAGYYADILGSLGASWQSWKPILGVWEASVAVLEPFGDCLGSLLGRCGAILQASWTILGAPWAILGCRKTQKEEKPTSIKNLRGNHIFWPLRAFLEDVLEASLGPLRASWAILKPAWAVLGSLEAILAVLETSSSHLGSHLGRLGRLGGILETS